MVLPEMKVILYTTSLSDHTRPVFRQAVKLAGLYQAKLVMLHVLKPIGETGEAFIRSHLSKEIIDKLHDEGIEEIKQKMQKRVAAFYQDEMVDTELPHMEQRVVEGSDSYIIVDIANELNADLIVMGSHNKFGRSSATTRKVIKHSGRPVFVVPTES